MLDNSPTELGERLPCLTNYHASHGSVAGPLVNPMPLASAQVVSLDRDRRQIRARLQHRPLFGLEGTIVSESEHP